MVRNRVKLHLEKAGIYTGNPMTAKHGIKHLHWVKQKIKYDSLFPTARYALLTYEKKLGTLYA